MTPTKAMMKPLTTAEAADALGISLNYLRDLLRAGRIEGAYVHGRDWMIPAPPKITKATRGPGRPPVGSKKPAARAPKK